MNKQEFYEAPKGFIVLDKYNEKWEFFNDPQITPFRMVHKDSEPARLLLCPDGNVREITFTYHNGIPRLEDQISFKFIEELEVID